MSDQFWKQPGVSNAATASSECPLCGGYGLAYYAGKPDGVDLATGKPSWSYTPIEYNDSVPFRFYDKYPGAFLASNICPCVADILNRRRLEKIMGQPDVPQDALNFDFGDFKAQRYSLALDYAQQLVGTGCIDSDGVTKSGLLMVGPTGTGKTTLAAIIFRKLVEQNKTVVWTDYTAFVKKIQATYNKDYSGPSDRVIIENVANAEMLILDDIGQKTGQIKAASDNRIEIMYEIFAVREKRKLMTIITSNLTVEELYVHFGQRVVSRMRGLCHGVAIEGRDFRAPEDFTILRQLN